MECTVPEWPGANFEGQDFPVDDFGRSIYKLALENEGPVRFTQDENPLDPENPIHKKYSIITQLAMAIHPKIGEPWLLAIHNCEVTAEYTENDCALFQALANRLSDGLTSLISWQNTKKLFDSAEVSI